MVSSNSPLGMKAGWLGRFISLSPTRLMGYCGEIGGGKGMECVCHPELSIKIIKMTKKKWFFCIGLFYILCRIAY